MDAEGIVLQIRSKGRFPSPIVSLRPNVVASTRLCGGTGAASEHVATNLDRSRQIRTCLDKSGHFPTNPDIAWFALTAAEQIRVGGQSRRGWTQ